MACPFVREILAVRLEGKILPHNFNSFPVLELVRGGVGASFLAADKGTVDAVGFNGGDRGAVLY
jgi:hypothetical protein